MASNPKGKDTANILVNVPNEENALILRLKEPLESPAKYLRRCLMFFLEKNHPEEAEALALIRMAHAERIRDERKAKANSRVNDVAGKFQYQATHGAKIAAASENKSAQPKSDKGVPTGEVQGRSTRLPAPKREGLK